MEKFWEWMIANDDAHYDNIEKKYYLQSASLCIHDYTNQMLIGYMLEYCHETNNDSICNIHINKTSKEKFVFLKSIIEENKSFIANNYS